MTQVILEKNEYNDDSYFSNLWNYTHNFFQCLLKMNGTSCFMPKHPKLLYMEIINEDGNLLPRKIHILPFSGNLYPDKIENFQKLL